jgi:DNA-binding response OmpR family regulator
MLSARGEDVDEVRGLELAIHFQNQEVTLAGQPVKLTPVEYKVLYHLILTRSGAGSRSRTLRACLRSESRGPTASDCAPRSLGWCRSTLRLAAKVHWRVS